MFERKKGILLVSDCISVFSFVLYYLFSLFIDMSGSIFGAYGLVGSTIISLLTFTINLVLLLRNKSEDRKIKKCLVNSFCFSCFFFALNVISSVLFYFNVVLGNHIVFNLIAPVPILLGILVTYIVFSKLSKKYDLCEISKEVKRLKKKMTVITTTICVLSLVIGTALGVFQALSMETYTTTKVFIGDEGGYLTSEDGISDYNKIKKFVVNDDDLYLLIEEEDKGILVSMFNYSFQNTEEGYKVTYKGMFEIEYIAFETYEEKAEFIDKYVIEEDKSSFMDSMDENIKFNDVNYTITYKHIINYADLIATDCSFYICSISMGLIPFIGLMTLIYHRKNLRCNIKNNKVIHQESPCCF